MAQQLKIGMIGLDTSHCQAFTKYLNNPAEEHYVPGGKVVVAYPGGSPDFEMSYSRLDKYTALLRDEYGVQIVDSPEQVAEQSDAILLTSVDGRVHLEQFAKVAPYRKPVFIDKPFAVSSEHAGNIARIAGEYRVPFMSASSNRFSDSLVAALDGMGQDVYGAECFGPMAIQDTQPGLFWYGIHAVEMLYSILGRGCLHVTAATTEAHEFVVGVWRDGRIGAVRGNRKGNAQFGAAIHGAQGTQFVHAKTKEQTKPNYVALLERVMLFFQTGRPAVETEETLEVIRFIEAANESRETGKTVAL